MLGELMRLQGCEIEPQTRSADPTANRLAAELMVICTSPALRRDDLEWRRRRLRPRLAAGRLALLLRVP